MRTAGRGVVAAAAAALALAVVPVPAGAATQTITIRDSSFTPSFVKIKVGDSVTWTNEGSLRHTVTAYDEEFDSSPETTDGNCQPLLGSSDCVEPGSTFNPGRFTEPGTYDFYCKVTGHADTSVRPTGGQGSQPCGMCGRIVVERPRKQKPTIAPTDDPTEEPTTSATPTETKKPRPKRSPTPSGTATPSGVAAGDTGSDGDATGRAILAFVLIGVLGGAGYLIWRRFIAGT